jgi:hypothetical protein
MSGPVCEHGSLQRVCLVCELEARIAELEADVVWAIERGGFTLYHNAETYLDCDGTPADILRAVREARNGVS